MSPFVVVGLAFLDPHVLKKVMLRPMHSRGLCQLGFAATGIRPTNKVFMFIEVSCPGWTILGPTSTKNSSQMGKKMKFWERL